MHVRHNETLIQNNGDDPFKNCKLNRKQYAEILTNVISTYKDGFVLAINSEWGSGKTTFVKMWQQYLKNNSFSTIYFNAWENDYQQEVIIALLSELDEFKNKGEEKFKKVLQNTIPLLKKIGPELLKYAMTKAVGEEVVGTIASSIGENTIEKLEDNLKEYNYKKRKINEFRVSLQEFVNDIDSEKPVVFIIDELDRCRPSYAVEVLEQIKHLFNVPGVVFVLSIDKVQLGHAIRGVYGSEQMDAEEYLRRFIDIDYSLPKPRPNTFCKYLIDYFQISSFFKSDERVRYGEFNNDLESFTIINSMLFEHNNLTLRQTEKILGHTSIVMHSFEQNQYVFPLTLFFMLYLKLVKNEIFQSITNKEWSIQELANVIESNLPSLDKEGSTNYYPYLIAETLCLYSNYLKPFNGKTELLSKDDETNMFKLKISFKYIDNKKELEIINIIRRFFGNFNFGDTGLNHLLNRINLTENFKNI